MATTKYTIRVYGGETTETHTIFADIVSFGPNYLKFLNGTVTSNQELVASFPSKIAAIVQVEKELVPIPKG